MKWLFVLGKTDIQRVPVTKRHAVTVNGCQTQATNRDPRHLRYNNPTAISSSHTLVHKAKNLLAASKKLNEHLNNRTQPPSLYNTCLPSLENHLFGTTSALRKQNMLGRLHDPLRFVAKPNHSSDPAIVPTCTG